MQNRTAYLVIGMLGLCCLGLLVSVVYPVSTAEPHADRPSEEQFAVADLEQYSMSGQVVVDGDQQFGFEEVRTANRERYQRLEETDSSTERYQPDSNASIYIRHTMDAEANVDAMREQITGDESRQLRQENRSNDRVTFVFEENKSNSSIEFPNSAAVVVRSLSPVEYTQTNETAETADSRPQSGWYGDSEGYRVTNTTGDVRVDTETYEVESASVSWDVTNPASSYAEYVLQRLASDAPTTHEVVVDVQEGDPEPTQPTWAVDAQDTNTTSGF